MSIADIDARGLLSLLFHADKALDVVDTAWSTGLLDALDAGPVSLKALSERLRMVPGRLYKLLDCLESLGLVERRQTTGDLLEARFLSREPLARAAELVLAADSIERDRDRQPWRTIHGRLAEVVRGEHGVADHDFAWPPATDDQRAQFERSMAAGIGPIVESFAAAADRLWPTTSAAGGVRLLDVGGGDGSLAMALVDQVAGIGVDVYNLPALAALARERIAQSPHAGRLDFVGGDFLAEPLPRGYHAISFVRVLHDWPADVARELLVKAYAALPPGGRVIICEELRTPSRLAVQFFWTYFLTGVDSCGSRLREVGHYRRVLAEVGFADMTVIPGPFDIIVASRPTDPPSSLAVAAQASAP